ncbi:hypothetical protein HK102_000632, partial [Quaeritorhiza haematococci]
RDRVVHEKDDLTPEAHLAGTVEIAAYLFAKVLNPSSNGGSVERRRPNSIPISLSDFSKPLTLSFNIKFSVSVKATLSSILATLSFNIKFSVSVKATFSFNVEFSLAKSSIRLSIVVIFARSIDRFASRSKCCACDVASVASVSVDKEDLLMDGGSSSEGEEVADVGLSVQEKERME